MVRLFLIAILLECSLTAFADGAADTDSFEDFFPLQVNNRWTYRIQGQEERLYIFTTQIEKIGAVNCVRLEGRLRGQTVANEHLAIRKEGVFRYRLDGVDIEPPLPICKPIGRSSKAWKLDYKVGEKKASIAYELDWDDIAVPLGKYKALRIQSEVPDGNSKLKNTCWYASKVGMVKQVIDDGDNKIVLELEKFERDRVPGKKFP